MLDKIGFGGGCHWCTEAVFQAIKGVAKVEQGWIASMGKNKLFSEAVIVHYSSKDIDLFSLIAMHLYTHSCTSKHAFRDRYRSAIYTFSKLQATTSSVILHQLQSEFEKPIITQILPYVSFKANIEKYQDYYLKNPTSQFCKNYINPKFKILMQQFSEQVKEKIMCDL